MIRRSFLLVLLFVSGCLLWWAKTWSADLVQAWRNQQAAPSVVDVSIRHTFELTGDWLRFPVAPRAFKVRMLTTAVMRQPLPPLDYSEVRPGWRYAIEVELIDDQREAVYRQIMHYRSNTSEYLLPDQSEFVTPSRFDDPGLVPLSTRQFQLATDKLAKRIVEARVRLASADPEVRLVTVRCASIIERIGYDDPDLWQHRSNDQKERLCRAAIYPAELLSPEQRKNLLRWRTVPTPPLGLEGHDYRRIVMYSRDELEGIEVGRDYTPEGIVIGADKRRVVRLPEAAGIVRLEAEAADLLTATTRDLERTLATVQWYDANNQRQQAGELKLEAPKHKDQAVRASTQLNGFGGWLEIIGLEPVAVRLSWEDAVTKESLDVTPQAKSNGMYLCEDQVLRFPLHHLRDCSTPLRLSARQLLRKPSVAPSPVGGSETFASDPAALRWTFLDGSGQVLRTDELVLTPVVSAYDSADRPDPCEDVSDDVQLFFRVPNEARQLLIEPVAGKTLVHVATRPVGIPIKKVVSDLAASEDEVALVREWFPIRAEQHGHLAKHQRVVRVQISPRPPELDKRVLAGDYLWEDFRPRDGWSGRGLLIPTTPSSYVRDEALLALFSELAVNAESAVEIQSASTYEVEVDFAILSPAAQARDTVIRVDGEVQVVGNRIGRCEIYRVNLLPGVRHITVAADSEVRVLVNNSRRPDALSMVKRMMGIALTSTGHTFCFRKESYEEELLLVDVFRLVDDASQPMHFHASLSSVEAPTTLEPLRSLSHNSLEYLIDAARASEPRGYVVGTDERITGGRRCYLWLGEDLPPGEHELHLSTDATGVFVVVSRTTPGQFSHRRVFRSN